MNFSEIKAKAKSFLKRKTFILGAVIFFLFLSTLILIAGNFLIPQDKSWQINLIYNSTSGKLSLEKLALLQTKIIPDERGALYSPYSLKVLDKANKTLYESRINISESMLYDYVNVPGIKTVPLADSFKSVVFVPYQKGAFEIIISKNAKTVLRINLPKNITFNFIEKAKAQVRDVSCGPITTVFINDNYTNIDQFKKDVQTLETLYNTTSPYNVNPSIFDFKEIDNPQNYACDKPRKDRAGKDIAGINWCIANLQDVIQSTGLKNFPSARKFVVVVNSPNAFQTDGGIAGVVNGIGGDVVIYTNYAYPGPLGNKPFMAATHELEGHAIGFLWDRYVKKDPSYAVIPAGYQQTNCSVSPNGIPFWNGAGSTGVFRGCGNQNQYAPFPLTCNSFNTDLLSGGTFNTIMSAIGCSPNEFDSVEQNWLKNHVLPYYKPCSGGPQVTLPPISTPTPIPTPTPMPIAIIHNIKGTAFIDYNYNNKQDSNEPGYPGLNIYLSGKSSLTTVTDNNGRYLFANLPSGTYTITARDQRINFNPSNLIDLGQNISDVTANFPIPPSALATPTPTPTPTPVPTPTPTSLPTPTPVPTPTPNLFPTLSPVLVTPTPTPTPLPAATYTCVLDPSCVTGQKILQICPLICTPNP